MNTENPYQTPEADTFQESPEEYCELKLFSFTGRLGRIRGILYNVGMNLILWAVLFGVGIIAAIISLAGEAGGSIAGIIGGIGYFAILIASMVAGLSIVVRRLHDINWSGWLALLAFVPLLNLVIVIVMLFIPGTKGANDYGPPPPPNKGWMVPTVIAVFVAIPLIIGILAAIAVPAYNDYLERAKQQQIEQRQE